MRRRGDDAAPDNRPTDLADGRRLSRLDGLARVGSVAAYSADPLVRRAGALQATKAAMDGVVRLSRATLRAANLEEDAPAVVTQGDRRVTLPLEIDDRLPDGCVQIQSGVAESEKLGGQFGEVTLEKA